jgi:hypothetical protein
MKTYVGLQVQLHKFLASEVDGVSCELHAMVTSSHDKSVPSPIVLEAMWGWE